MDKKPYDPSEIEKKLYQEWEESGLFKPDDSLDTYSLAIPPPNVTGTLHMGHGFQSAIMDCLIRYHRMSGKNTLWQVGTDHAGIATEMVVERRLNAEGKTKESLGRQVFEQKVWDWKKYSGNKITAQLSLLAVRCRGGAGSCTNVAKPLRVSMAGPPRISPLTVAPSHTLLGDING